MTEPFLFATGGAGPLGALLFALVFAALGFASGVLWTRHRLAKDPEFLAKAQAALVARREAAREKLAEAADEVGKGLHDAATRARNVFKD